MKAGHLQPLTKEMFFHTGLCLEDGQRNGSDGDKHKSISVKLKAFTSGNNTKCLHCIGKTVLTVLLYLVLLTPENLLWWNMQSVWGTFCVFTGQLTMSVILYILIIMSFYLLFAFSLI